ncbi:lipid asymmetry maintenance protein MlaB [Thalassomonas sp. M1454]|uniref:STAS domain-containing protein n=1 Tax=Thalassomonas sp. M1454 TaxID=2594477 RepID=UPI00163DDCD7|nr:STAS domain-containing protein [Thalassomonas sp. M1454]
MANSFELKNIDEQNWQIVGELTRHTISGRQQKYFSVLAGNTTQSIDLTHLSKVDTAGLAWLLTLIEYAKLQQIELTYSQAPAELVKLAKLSHVDSFLSMTTKS